jgi:uncharacterized membrane protein YcaP (DUF421 family)
MAMSGLVDTLFGSGSDLDGLQMVDRGIAVFVLALLMVRMAGRRSFGQHRPFDACATVLLGSVLSRAVVGASPFWPTMLSGVAIVAMHRLIGMASVRWPAFERLVSGDKRELVKDGMRDAHEMGRALITGRDLDEAVRAKTGDERSPLARAVLERDGRLTIQPASPPEQPKARG